MRDYFDRKLFGYPLKFTPTNFTGVIIKRSNLWPFKNAKGVENLYNGFGVVSHYEIQVYYDL